MADGNVIGKIQTGHRALLGGSEDANADKMIAAMHADYPPQNTEEEQWSGVLSNYSRD
jgi:hypothetical protein